MQLSKYISDLLYRYECVIVPNFGGFVSNTIPSERNVENHQFTPPSKTISFNINLKQNDGLLINYISKSLNISFDNATSLVDESVAGWQKTIENSSLELDNIGLFTLENEQLVFEPINKTNYLTSSFGLSSVDADYILRNSVDTPKKAPVKKTYYKYIASAAIVTGLLFGGNLYVKQQLDQQEIAHQQAVTNKIQQASFNILKPLPALNITVEKREIIEDETELIEESFKYHIIAGAFKELENAEKKVETLIRKGFNASIIGVNKWGLTQVSYAAFNDKREAINTLNTIRKKDNKHAWLFINQ